MPSPVGHTLLGLGIYIVWCKNLRNWLNQWPLVLWVVFCANLPDFDLLLGIFKGDMSRYHQTYTHTVGFALTVALLTFIVMNYSAASRGELTPVPTSEGASGLKIKSAKNTYSIFLLTFIAVFSNPILDLFNYDSRIPVGVMLFWPFSNQCFHLCSIFYAVPHSWVGDVFTSFFLNAIIREILLLFIPVSLLVVFKLWKK